jgi:hypothetical protein
MTLKKHRLLLCWLPAPNKKASRAVQVIYQERALSMRAGEAVRTLLENVTIAVMRRPSLSWTVKGTGLDERHFPPDLRPAFNIAMTMSQVEIRRLVKAKDPRVWPLYGKRIIEWREDQARAAAGQIVRSMECSEDYNAVSADYRDDSSICVPEVKPGAIHEPPEERSLFEGTLEAIRDIIGDLEEISSKRIVDELARIGGGPWAHWGKGKHKKPITQHALARLLKPHNVSPVDVGPEHSRRKGYKRAQFERLFQAYLNTPEGKRDAQA